MPQIEMAEFFLFVQPMYLSEEPTFLYEKEFNNGRTNTPTLFPSDPEHYPNIHKIFYYLSVASIPSKLSFLVSIRWNKIT